MRRYFIYMAYDGTNYHGWQIQPNGVSVQGILMKALSTYLRREVEVVGAGRTDAGVHALLMVAHFDYEGELQTEILTDKLNRLLPPDISIYKVVPVLMLVSMLYRVHINIILLQLRNLFVGNILVVCSVRLRK